MPARYAFERVLASQSQPPPIDGSEDELRSLVQITADVPALWRHPAVGQSMSSISRPTIRQEPASALRQYEAHVRACAKLSAASASLAVCTVRIGLLFTASGGCRWV